MKKKLTTKEELVFVKNDDVFTDSKIISVGTKTTHHAIQQLLKKYKNELEELGTFRISNAKSTGGRKENIYLLNEPQASFYEGMREYEQIYISQRHKFWEIKM